MRKGLKYAARTDEFTFAHQFRPEKKAPADTAAFLRKTYSVQDFASTPWQAAFCGSLTGSLAQIPSSWPRTF